MHPAFSVILFTVLSGAGYGLLALLAFVWLFAIDGSQPSNAFMTTGILTGLGLVTIGLASSTLHLANPKNAWRAFSRFRTSWLAREGLMAVLFYPIILSWLAPFAFDWEPNAHWQTLNAALVMIWALGTVFTTGMIYACLKTIPQWNTSLTPANYLMLGLMLGSVLLATLKLSLTSSASRDHIEVIAIGFIITAGILKLLYYFWIGKPQGPTINTATGFTRATVRLLDVGHTSGTFLTDEFGYQVARLRLLILRWAVYLFAFALPASFIALGSSSGWLYAACASALLGVLIERWLFFAEARHVVTLYHGNQQV